MTPRIRPVQSMLLYGLFAVLLAAPVRAQIVISLKSRYAKYLRYEPVEMIVSLQNYSGNTLIFGGEGKPRGYLDFLVNDHANAPVSSRGVKVNPVEDLILGPGEMRTLTVQLNRWFDFQRVGSYTIRAQVGHDRLEHDYRTKPETIEIRQGLTLIGRDVGLPSHSSSDRIKAYKVSLLQFHDGIGAMYCLRVEDKNSVYGTARLGPLIQSSKPEMDADSTSDIHILFQVRARLYSSMIYSLTGGRLKLRQQRYYVSEPGVPHLMRRDGYLKVIGGRPAEEGVDYKLNQPGTAAE